MKKEKKIIGLIVRNEKGSYEMAVGQFSRLEQTVMREILEANKNTLKSKTGKESLSLKDLDMDTFEKELYENDKKKRIKKLSQDIFTAGIVKNPILTKKYKSAADVEKDLGCYNKSKGILNAFLKALDDISPSDADKSLLLFNISKDLIDHIKELQKELSPVNEKAAEGKWSLIYTSQTPHIQKYKCSKCGRTISSINNIPAKQEFPFCHCGAKMS